MKKKAIMISVLSAVLLSACKSRYIVGKDIRIDDLTEFYYTRSNINFNASYQRYHFFAEEGKHMFFHETRKRENQYGPTTEKDTVLTGTFELTDEEWTAFFDLLKDGTVIKRTEHTDAGGSGPWMYLYWKNDRSKIQEYEFASYEMQLSFESFCEDLAQRDQAASPQISAEGWYVYPAPEELNSLTEEEKYNACRISQDVLDTLSDDALVRAAAEYPLLSELYEYSDPEQPVGFFPDDCTAYGEILKRKDPAQILLKGIANLPSYGRQDTFIRDSLGLIILFDKRLDGGFTREELNGIAEMTTSAVIADTEEAYDLEYDFIREVTFKDRTKACAVWYADGRP
ncbi:MAG TPA: hypothetical protein DCG51_09030 [Erysipelotrichaceae bacterium]|nr:hypothetical protein [Erysipelotrichaceae bacterium]